MTTQQPINSTNKFCIVNNTIYFYNNFDEPLDEYYNIINSVKHLKFSDPPNDQNERPIYKPSSFNRPMEIPFNLTSIEFGQKFNHPINLTPELTCVQFGSSFNQLLTCTKKLIRLSIRNSSKQPSILLPKYLEHLTANHITYKLPICLNKNIKYADSSCVPISLTKKLINFWGMLGDDQQTNLPKNLTHLLLGCNYLIEYLVLPKNIKSIHIIGWINPFILTPNIISIESYKPFPNVIIEQSVKKINISNPALIECLPNTVTHIVTCSLKSINNIPSSVQHIRLEINEKEQRVKNKLSPNVIIEYPKCYVPHVKINEC